MIGSIRRRPRLRTGTAWVLVLAFLCQPILTYLVTPTVVRTSEGFRAVICTLQGARREVEIQLPSIDDTARAVNHCPAIKLIQLAGTVQPVEPPQLLRAVLHALTVVDEPSPPQAPQRPFAAYASRAPPPFPLA
ncbi:MAG TPA: hypothetical protein ENJ94_05790 [Gammaproteobacteria bacterium]|nr:hypothetical protein [Gammaproteobacteria bacterium]